MKNTLANLLAILIMVTTFAFCTAAVYNSNTMIKITDSPYNGAVTTGSQLLLNGANAVWTNGSPGFDTLSVNTDHIRIDSLINTAGTTESCHSNTITISNATHYVATFYLSHTSGQYPTVSGTNGFPTTTLKSGTNYLYWKSTATSVVITITNTATGNNQIGLEGYPQLFSLYAMNDNSTALEAARIAAETAGKDIYVPAGVYYVVPSSIGGFIARIIGNLQTNSILYSDGGVINISGLSDIKLDQIIVRETTTGSPRYNSILLDSVTFNFIGNTSTYLVYLGGDVLGQRYYIKNCTVNGSGIYGAIYLVNYIDAAIENNTILTGTTPLTGAYFNIYVAPGSSMAQTLIEGNNITYGTTGIFSGTQREYPVENIKVKNNTITGITEEAISFDGFGNNSGLCPVIANGTLSSASNDVNGRLVLGLDNFKYYGTDVNQTWTVANGSGNASYPLTNFYFTLGYGTGVEGTIAKIYDYSVANNTVTLDLYTLASDVTLTGDGGIQSGFFNVSVENNKITNTATALSIYLNVFNSHILGNTIIGCGTGINLLGGLMLSTYYTLAWNNTVSGNTFIDSGNDHFGLEFTSAAFFGSIYGGHKDYNNKFINNTVIGGRIFLEKQGNFIYKDNSTKNTTIRYVP
jgi:hypothetical protein